MQNKKEKQKKLSKVFEKKHVMISYNWTNSNQVKEIVTILEPYVHIWRDKSNLAGAKDLWTEIANAISKSEFVIAILTQEYEQSDSCTNELNYALNISIPVVPIFLDPKFRPTGNVGLRTSKLFYIIIDDIIQNPLLFVKHLYAMSVKANKIDLDVQTYSAPCLKYSMEEIESMISLNYKNKLSDCSNNQCISHDSNNNKINGHTFSFGKNYDVERLKNEESNSSSNLGLSSDSETESHGNFNSLNVYCMQTKITGHQVNYTDLAIPYKLGDCMYLKNDNSKNKDDQKEIQNIENKLSSLNIEDRIQSENILNEKLELTKSNSSNKLDPNQYIDENKSRNRSLESSARHSFHIHQNKPDYSEYDLYTREKDELMSFVCHGKEADIEDADYQEVYELKPKLSDNQLILELIIKINNDLISCFSLIKDDLLLIATEKGDFQLLRPMKDKWDFLRFTLNPKFNGNDAEMYKSGVKSLIDMCFDAKGNLILLNRWKFKKEEKDLLSENEFIFKYTIELYSFNSKATETIIYLKTICCISNEKQSVCSISDNLSPINTSTNNLSNLNNTNNSNLNKTIDRTEKSPIFTRIYNDEKSNSIVLIDSANSKIYWFKKSTGTKRRCLKSQDNSLKDPKSLAFSYDEKEAETIYVCSKGGLLAMNKNFNIKHDTLVSLEDVYYDSFEKCLLFIDSKNLYGGRIFRKQTNENEVQNEAYQASSINTDLRYKRLHTNSINGFSNFYRLLSTKNYIFILSDRRTSIFAIDKHKLQSIS